jgi:dihydroorotate dehydrogenase (NAD+) catalytic subunit
MMTRKKLGPSVPLIATNGARNGLDVARFLLSGAAATEMTSAIFTGGYQVIAAAVAELEAYVRQRGKTVSELLGEAADRVETYQDQQDRPQYWREFAPFAAPVD